MGRDVLRVEGDGDGGRDGVDEQVDGNWNRRDRVLMNLAECCMHSAFLSAFLSARKIAVKWLS